MSDTKSLIVKSISWPTADTIGLLELYIALATISSLKAHKSSIEPPPRPSIITSTSDSLASLIILTIFSLAPTPCTKVGKSIISVSGNLLLIVLIISFTAAPVEAVITPTFLGILGNFFLCSGLNKPSLSNRRFNSSKSMYKLPIPSSFILLTVI